MSRLRLRLFGSPSIDPAHAAPELRAPESVTLVALLLLDPGQSRARLAALLWPDVDAGEADRRLEDTLGELRRILGPDAAVTGETPARITGQVSCDVLEFEDAVARRDHARAIALYAGPFLDGIAPPSAELRRWIETRRTRLADDFGAAVQALADAPAQPGHDGGTIGASPAARLLPAPIATAVPAKRPGRGRVEGGTVTFLFTDIEGSTALLQQLGERYADVLAAHHAIVRSCVQAEHGRVIDTAGDGFFVVFPSAHDATTAAVCVQRRLALTHWPDGAAVRVRMGLHTGEPLITTHGYVGIDVHRAARICGAARGGRILLSATTRELMGSDLPDATHVIDLGLHELKGLARGEHLYELRLDGSETGEALHLPPASTASGSTNGTRRRVLLYGVPILLAGAAWLTTRPEPPVPTPTVAAGGPAAVAVLPFRIAGDAELAYLREGMVNLLAIELEIPRELRAIDSDALLGAVKSRGAPDDLTPDLARQVAERFDARYAVLGSVTRTGPGRAQLTANVHDLATSSRLGPVTVEGLTDEIDALVDDLATGLLSEILGGSARRLSRLALSTSDSLSAIRAWLAGEQAFRAGRYRDAVERFQEATRIDPGFALAHYRLSMAAEWNLDFNLVSVHAKQALDNVSALAQNDRRLIEAWNHVIVGAADRAAGIYRDLLNARPDEVEAWYGLGEAIVHFHPVHGRPTAEARQIFAEVLALGSDYGDARHHMLEFASADRDSAAFEALLAGVDSTNDQWLAWNAVRAFGWGTEPDRARILQRLRNETEKVVGAAAARVAASLRDFEGAARVVSILLDREAGDEWRAAGHIMQAELLYASGRYRDALDEIGRAARLEPLWASQIRAVFSLPSFVPADEDELRGARAAIADLDPSDVPLPLSFFFAVHAYSHAHLKAYLPGMLSVRLGELDAARIQVRSLEDLSGNELTRGLQTALRSSLLAHIDIARGDTDAALRKLRNTGIEATIEQVGLSPFYARSLDRLATADLLRTAGSDSAAVRFYRSLTEGYEVLFVGPAHYHLAELFERMNQPDSAAFHRERFDKLWERADPAVAERLRRRTEGYPTVLSFDRAYSTANRMSSQSVTPYQKTVHASSRSDPSQFAK